MSELTEASCHCLICIFDDFWDEWHHGDYILRMKSMLIISSMTPSCLV